MNFPRYHLSTDQIQDNRSRFVKLYQNFTYDKPQFDKFKQQIKSDKTIETLFQIRQKAIHLILHNQNYYEAFSINKNYQSQQNFDSYSKQKTNTRVKKYEYIKNDQSVCKNKNDLEQRQNLKNKKVDTESFPSEQKSLNICQPQQMVSPAQSEEIMTKHDQENRQEKEECLEIQITNSDERKLNTPLDAIQQLSEKDMQHNMINGNEVDQLNEVKLDQKSQNVIDQSLSDSFKQSEREQENKQVANQFNNPSNIIMLLGTLGVGKKSIMRKLFPNIEIKSFTPFFKTNCQFQIAVGSDFDLDSDIEEREIQIQQNQDFLLDYKKRIKQFFIVVNFERTDLMKNKVASVTKYFTFKPLISIIVTKFQLSQNSADKENLQKSFRLYTSQPIIFLRDDDNMNQIQNCFENHLKTIDSKYEIDLAETIFELEDLEETQAIQEKLNQIIVSFA